MLREVMQLSLNSGESDFLTAPRLGPSNGPTKDEEEEEEEALSRRRFSRVPFDA